MYTCICAYIYIYIYTHPHRHRHAHTHTHTHTHTHYVTQFMCTCVCGMRCYTIACCTTYCVLLSTLCYVVLYQVMLHYAMVCDGLLSFVAKHVASTREGPVSNKGKLALASLRQTLNHYNFRTASGKHRPQAPPSNITFSGSWERPPLYLHSFEAGPTTRLCSIRRAKGWLAEV